jgi:hypothetical protein
MKVLSHLGVLLVVTSLDARVGIRLHMGIQQLASENRGARIDIFHGQDFTFAVVAGDDQPVLTRLSQHLGAHGDVLIDLTIERAPRLDSRGREPSQTAARAAPRPRRR